VAALSQLAVVPRDRLKGLHRVMGVNSAGANKRPQRVRTRSFRVIGL
jgi:hypothetical protein